MKSISYIRNRKKVTEHIYSVEEYDYSKMLSIDFIESNKEFWNEPITFDIETTSINNDLIKKHYGFMYIWAVCILGDVIMGRTWNEFLLLLNKIRNALNLEKKKLL